jgi:hypothetical protein
MRHWLLFVVAAVIISLLPKGQGTDIGKLQPAELIYIYKEENTLVLETDTGDVGSGETLQEALADMEATSFGEVFLETMNWILVTEDTKQILKNQWEKFRLSAQVVLVTGPVDVKTISQYLQIHKSNVTLKDYVAGQKELPKLMTAGERYYLE